MQRRKLPRQGDSFKGEFPAVVWARYIVGQGVTGLLFVVLTHSLRADLTHMLHRLEYESLSITVRSVRLYRLLKAF